MRIEPHRYPDDFGSPRVGARAMSLQDPDSIHNDWQAARNCGKNGADPLGRLPADPAPGVPASCDATNKLQDGLIANPVACTFGPATVQYEQGTSACQTAEEVAVHRFPIGPLWTLGSASGCR